MKKSKLLTGNGTEVLLPMGAFYSYWHSTPKRVKAQLLAAFFIALTLTMTSCGGNGTSSETETANVSVSAVSEASTVNAEKMRKQSLRPQRKKLLPLRKQLLRLPKQRSVTLPWRRSLTLTTCC